MIGPTLRAARWGLLMTAVAACAPPVDVSLSAADLDFGLVPVTDGERRAVRVFNRGLDEVLVEVASTDVLWPPAGTPRVWATDLQVPTALSAGDELAITVTFAPNREGPHAARLALSIRGREGADAVEARVDLRGVAGPTLEDTDGDGWSPWEGDCAPDDPSVHPQAPEVCDGLDSDCDGVAEVDGDGDSYLACGGCASPVLCGDCDDTNPRVFPDQPEACDGLDTDCDPGTEDEADVDGDAATPCAGDCDDGDSSIGPRAEEICGDGIDNDCSGAADDRDEDRDTHSACVADRCDDDPLAVPIHVGASLDACPEGHPRDGSPACPYATVEAALPHRHLRCPVVYLRDGDHTASVTLDLVGEGLHLLGESREGTTLRPRGERILTIETGDANPPLAGAVVQLERLSLSGDGSACDDGLRAGAIAMRAESAQLADRLPRLRLLDVHAEGFHAPGGVILLENGGDDAPRIEVEAARLQGNDGCEGGGGLSLQGGDLDVVSTAFTENVAEASGVGGAALLLAGGRAEVGFSCFYDNGATAIVAEGTLAGELLGNVVHGGDANADAAGIPLGARLHGDWTLTHNTLVALPALSAAEVEAALELEGGALTLQGNIVQGGFAVPVADDLELDSNTFFQAGDSLGWGAVLDFALDGNRLEDPRFAASTSPGCRDPGDRDQQEPRLRDDSPSRNSGPADRDRGFTGAGP